MPQKNALKICLASSEFAPLAKTGGLADVSGSLPPALRSQGHDVRLVLPAYAEVIERAGKLETITSLVLSGAGIKMYIFTRK